jgi:dynein heavy chain, axonemal
MALEAPSTVARNARKNLENVTKPQLESGGFFNDEFRKLICSITVMHAMICRKEQYGAFGWSKSGYEFSPNDFDISIHQICDIFMNLDKEQRIPCQLIHHILTYINYGSVVVDEQDLRNLHNVLIAFVHRDMFALSESNTNLPEPYDLTGTDLKEFKDNRIQHNNAGFYGRD